jgi:hypothetical protein
MATRNLRMRRRRKEISAGQGSSRILLYVRSEDHTRVAMRKLRHAQVDVTMKVYTAVSPVMGRSVRNIACRLRQASLAGPEGGD